jgi:tetratricopeptide (TPR) repeat protein
MKDLGESFVTQECHQCGLQSTIENVYVKKGKKTFCPPCHQEREQDEAVQFFTNVGIMGVIGLATLFFPHFGLGYFYAALSLFYVFLILMLVLHELSHALIAYLLGFQVFAIFMGTGKNRFKFNVGKTTIVLNTLPLSGIVYFVTDGAKFLRIRRFLSILAGPAVHILFVIALTLYLHNNTLESSFENLLFWPLLIVNVFLLAVNLFPWEYTESHGKQPSDGLALYQILRTATQQNNEYLFLYHQFTAWSAYNRKAYDESVEAIKQGLKLRADSPYLQNLLGIIYLEKEENQKARDVFKNIYDLIPPEQENNEFKYIILNNLAYADIMLRDTTLLQEADALSKEALERTPWLPFVKGTRGAVLVELGNLDDGLRLLEEAKSRHTETSGKANNACFISIAKSRQGQLNESQSYIALAKQLDPDNSLIKRAEEELQKALNKMTPQQLSIL